MRGGAPVRYRVQVVGAIGSTSRRGGPPASGKLRDQHGVGVVVPDVVVVGGAPVVVQRREATRGVQPAAEAAGVGRALGIPRRFLVPHPLHANRPADLAGQEGGFEAGVIGCGAAVRLRAIHPDDAHPVPRQAQEFGDTVAQPVRFHVVGVDRHPAVRRVGRGVRRADRRVALKRKLVLGLDHLCRPAQRAVGVADDIRSRGRHRRRRAHVGVQIVRGRERGVHRWVPVGAELPGGLNRLFLPLAHDRDVVALAHDLDEPGQVPHRRLVDARQLGASQRRFDVARVDHAGELHVHGPRQRAIDLGRNVVAGD